MAIDKRIKKFKEAYEEKKNIFHDFGNSLSNTIKTLLIENSFQYQVVSNRVKTFNSIENKIISGSIPQVVTNLNEIDDVIGCRVIFYLESDIQKFTNLIYNEFDVEKDNLRYSEDGYNALHLIIKLNSEKLSKMGKEQFIDLKCEIQLTTVLFHAWSEMAHNIIYKIPKELNEFDEHSVIALKNKFGEVMKNHLKPSSYTFEFINERFENLKQGKKVFDLEFLQNIIISNSRNEIYEKMKLLHQFINQFGDKTPDDFNLIEFILNVIQKSNSLNTIEINMPLGRMYGFEHYHIVRVCLDVLSIIGYSNIEETLKILIELSDDKEYQIKNKSIEILDKISSYNLKMIERIGYSLQLRLIHTVEEITIDTKLKSWEFFEKLFLNLLNLEFHDSSLVAYNEISIQSGVIAVNKQLIDIRKRIIRVIKEVYKHTNEQELRGSIFKVLLNATSLPRQANFNDEIEDMVLMNIYDITEWAFEEFEKFNLKEIKLLDESIESIFKNFTELKNRDKLNDLKLLIKNNTSYNVFKVLVGYDLSYNSEIGWREVRRIREKKTKEFLNDISASNYNRWEETIVFIAQSYSSKEQGEFSNFRTFLFELGKNKPSFAKELLDKNKGSLKNFLSNIVAGIVSDNKGENLGNQIILKCLDNKENISECASVYALSKRVNSDTFKKIFSFAKESEDIDALYNLFRAILTNQKLFEQFRETFIEIVKELTKHKQYYWTQHIWFEEDSILQVLQESDFNEMLNCLENFNSIGVHEQEILKPICIADTPKIIQFFENRVNIKIQKKGVEYYNRLTDNYNAIPNDFYDLHKYLRSKSDIVLPLLMEWFNKDNWLFHWEASHLIKNIFPAFEEPLQKYLIVLIENDDIDDARKVLRIIKEYKSSATIYDICKNLIKKHVENQELMRELTNVLTQPGLVFGEYGPVEAYKRIKKEVRKWQKPKNKEIRRFVSEFIKEIDSLIIRETKRADDNKELMIRRFE